MTELGIGIIGSGYMGRTYAECVARYNTDAHLVAVAGGSRAPGLAADYGAVAELSVEALLNRFIGDGLRDALDPGLQR